MTHSSHFRIFDNIAPIYDLFYGSQKRHFNTALDRVFKELDLQQLDLQPSHNVIDLGCGTGALCSVLHQRGLDVTGVDLSEKMLSLAVRKKENHAIRFFQWDILKQLPFEAKTFDIAVTSFVAHGLQAEERRVLYTEMQRIARHWVLIHDYNDKRSLVVNLAEWLEGGDYYNFVQTAKDEMQESFPNLHTLNTGSHSMWYMSRLSGDEQ